MIKAKSGAQKLQNFKYFLIFINNVMKNFD